MATDRWNASRETRNPNCVGARNSSFLEILTFTAIKLYHPLCRVLSLYGAYVTKNKSLISVAKGQQVLP
jgi:hypothetical protein